LQKNTLPAREGTMGLRLGLSFCGLAAACFVVLSGCGGDGGGGGGSGAAGSARTVVVSWAANREQGVNSSGGGYQVTISGRPSINVPYVSGPEAPTTVTAMLPRGTYVVNVRAFAALDAQGGSGTTFSAASQSIFVAVP
jgi:hypothetical protein